MCYYFSCGILLQQVFSIIFLMSLLDSVTVCLVDCGGAPKALSAFLAASMRKRPLGDVCLCHINPTKMQNLVYGPITHVAGGHNGYFFFFHLSIKVCYTSTMQYLLCSIGIPSSTMNDLPLWQCTHEQYALRFLAGGTYFCFKQLASRQTLHSEFSAELKLAERYATVDMHLLAETRPAHAVGDFARPAL